MVRLRSALPAALGVLLLVSFFFAPAADPPDQYAVSVEPDDYVSDPTPYADLSSGQQRAFDAARAADGTKVYTGTTYPEGVSFPTNGGLTSEAVSYQNTTYLVQFTHTIEGPGIAGIVRTLGSLAGGVALLAYAGYRRVNG